jgi:hypothetical protein
MLIRRILCALAFTFALKSAAYAQGGQAPPPPGPPPALVKVKEDLYVLQNQAHTMGDLIAYGGNATILLTDAGVLLIDSKSDREHDDLIAKLKTLTDKPVKYVVLTTITAITPAAPPSCKPWEPPSSSPPTTARI